MSPIFARASFIGVLLALAGLGGAALTPMTRSSAPAPDLEAMLPEEFGVWKTASLASLVLPAERKLQPGEAVAYRAYADDLGRIVTVVAAYGPPHGDSVRLHRPEKCYVAQGFDIKSRAERTLVAGGREILIVQLDAEGPSRREGVSYLLRDGSKFTTSAADAPWRRLTRVGAAPFDGVLLRASTVNQSAPQFDLQISFMQEFIAALAPDARSLILGSKADQ